MRFCRAVGGRTGRQPLPGRCLLLRRPPVLCFVPLLDLGAVVFGGGRAALQLREQAGWAGLGLGLLLGEALGYAIEYFSLLIWRTPKEWGVAWRAQLSPSLTHDRTKWHL